MANTQGNGARRNTLAIGILVVQIVMGFLQAALFYQLAKRDTDALAHQKRDQEMEARVDALERFASMGDRFTKDMGAVLTTRIAVLEREVSHLWHTHHPNENERSEVDADEALAQHHAGVQ